MPTSKRTSKAAKPLTPVQRKALARRRLRSAPQEQVLCRTFMHAWREPDDDDEILAQAPFGVTIAMVCLRCGAQRIDGVSRVSGDLITRKYAMPSGYVVRGSGGVSRRLSRVEYLARREGRRN